MLKWFRKLLKDEKGFTLIELMVVVVIIGILAAIAVPAFSDASDKAKVSKAKADLRTIESALEIYYAEHGEYPDADSDNTLPDVLEDDGYIKTIPEDPWGHTYVYKPADDNKSYELYSEGPNSSVSGDDIK